MEKFVVVLCLGLVSLPACMPKASPSSDNAAVQVATAPTQLVGLESSPRHCAEPPCQDSCQNGLWDLGEMGVDCGGTQCPPCQACRRDDDCAVGGFCDAALAHLCSKRCQSALDCRHFDPDRPYVCREDGRCSPEAFESLWELERPNVQLSLPISPDPRSQVCQIEVDWGEGYGYESLDCQAVSHLYQAPSQYRIKIRGQGFVWQNLPEREARWLRAIWSFGPIALGERAFAAVGNIGLPTRDIPNPLSWLSAEGLFEKSEFNQDISTWELSGVKNMKGIFAGAKAFQQDLSSWILDPEVDLSQSLQETALSQAQFCQLISADSPWKAQAKKLGLNFSCP